MAKKAQYDPLAGICSSHKPKLEWLTEEEVDRRAAKGERQAQCATCLRWLWPAERGARFVTTGRPDTD